MGGDKYQKGKKNDYVCYVCDHTHHTHSLHVCIFISTSPVIPRYPWRLVPGGQHLAPGAAQGASSPPSHTTARLLASVDGDVGGCAHLLGPPHCLPVATSPRPSQPPRLLLHRLPLESGLRECRTRTAADVLAPGADGPPVLRPPAEQGRMCSPRPSPSTSPGALLLGARWPGLGGVVSSLPGGCNTR